jgi:hypothetical protein
VSEMIERVDRAIVTEIARQMRLGVGVHYDLVAKAAIEAIARPLLDVERECLDANSVLRWLNDVEEALKWAR